jgi:hypothetical protein
MAETSQQTMTQNDILKGAAISGVINAVINGAIQFFLMRGSGPIPLSVDSIGTETHTVLGSSVPLAVSLAMILTAVAHFTLKAPKKPFVPTTLWLVIKHGLFAFGAVVAAAVVWQRMVGTVVGKQFLPPAHPKNNAGAAAVKGASLVIGVGQQHFGGHQGQHLRHVGCLQNVGGRPNSIGLKSTLGKKPPRLL